MAGNPTGAMGVPDYLGWDWKSKAGIPIVCVPGCPIHPDNLAETLTYLLYQATGQAPPIPLDDAAAPAVAVRRRPCTRAAIAPATTSRASSPPSTAQPTCIVKLGCWGPVVNCNVPKRGWINGIGGCPNVGGICIGCTMPGFPDKFMPFMDEPPGGKLSSGVSGLYGGDDPSPPRRHQQDAERRAVVAQAGQGTPDRIHAVRRRHDGHRHDTRRQPPTGPPRPTSNDDGIVEMAWDPITRIVGSLGIYTKIDLKQKVVTECKSTSSIFRGYSIFMKGKDPRDAHFITSRICGICGDNHATCACYAQNMAFGVKPPHIAEWIVNLGEAAEYMFDHNIFQENLVFVDFCEKMVRETNPSVWEKAKVDRGTATPTIHGYRTIADILSAFNPFEGEFYREALQVSRYTREMFCLMEGRHVHPSTLYPGGVGTTPTIQLFTDYMTRLSRYAEFMKRVVPMHDDVFDFWYEALPGYEEVGRRRVLLGCWGSFQDPAALRLHTTRRWRTGVARCSSRPAWCVDGKLRHHEPGRHQPRHQHPARLVASTTTGRARSSSSPRIRSATRSDHGTRGTSTPTRSRRSATSTTSTAG